MSRCKICGRELKDAESQKRGCGPSCWESLNREKPVDAGQIELDFFSPKTLLSSTSSLLEQHRIVKKLLQL